MLAAPFSRYGGKSRFLSHILPLLPAHDVWVELFCGSAAVTLAKSPAACETINDLDDGVATFYRVLRDPVLAPQLQTLLEQTPYSRSEFLACRAAWQSCDDPLERARQWFVVARQALVGRTNRTGWSFTAAHHTAAITTSRWRNAIAGLPEVHARLQYVQIECRDWRSVLAFWDRPETLLYADPPYPLSTRVGGRGYRHELTEEDHRDLVVALLRFRGRALVSGYEHPAYQGLDAGGWQRREIAVTVPSTGSTRGGGAKQHRTEILWCNYDPAAAYGQQSLRTVDEKGA